MKGSYGESKAKLGDRGHVRGPKTFNSSGARGGGSVQNTWQGKTNTAPKSKEKR